MSRLLALTAICLVAFGGASFAYWTGSGSGSASGSVGTLDAPVIAGVAAGSGSATISWSAVTAPGGPAVGYYVTRDGGPAVAACGLASSPITATSCTDTGLTPGERYTYRVVAVWRSWSQTSAPVQSDAIGASVHHLVVSSPGSQTAGSALSVTVTAKSEGGATIETYDGPRTVDWSGPQAAPDGTAPLYPSTATSLTFTDGVATATGIKLHRAAASTTLTATIGSTAGTSPAFAVAAASAAGFSIGNPGPQVAGIAFDLTVTARDAYGNTAAYSGAHALAWSGAANAPKGDAPVYPANVVFASGTGTASAIKLHRAGATTLTATEGSLTGSTPSFTVAHGAASRFSVANPGTRVAGSAFALSLTALDAFDNVATSYAGSRTVAFSGPANAPDGTAPSYPANVSFTAGVAPATVTLFNAAATTVTAADGSVSGTSPGFSVNPAPATTFSIGAIATQTASSAFPVTITARDPYGNLGDYAGSKPITFSGPASAPDGTAPAYPSSVAFANGVGTASVTLHRAATAVTLTASEGGRSATSASFTVNPGAAARYAWTAIAAGTGGQAPSNATVPSCLFSCTWTNFGSNKRFTGRVALTDARGNTLANVGTGRTVSFTTPAGSVTANASATTISPTGAAETSGTFSYSSPSGTSWTSDTLTVATGTGPAYTSATISVTRT